jgi:hypothetical protein
MKEEALAPEKGETIVPKPDNEEARENLRVQEDAAKQREEGGGYQ